jgi:hypothetical protein
MTGGRMKSARLYVVAALMICCMVFAGTASAANPEYGRCIKEGPKELSKYDNAKCLKLASEDPGSEAEKLKKGNYVWHPGAPPKAGFTAALEPSTISNLETKVGTKVTCTGFSSAGKYTGFKTVSVQKTDFSGCESGGIKCNTVGAGVGVIKAKELEGELGVITSGVPHTKDKIGNVLWPAGGTPTSGSEFAEFACGGLPVKVKNSIIAPVTANAMKLTPKVKYTSSKGVQKPMRFEGGPDTFLEGTVGAGPYEPFGIAAKTIQTNEEGVEIRSL